jgi:predicted phage-related endonuclease
LSSTRRRRRTARIQRIKLCERFTRATAGAALDLTADGDMALVFADLLAVRGELGDAKTREAGLKQRIQQRMGEASRAIFVGGEVSWKRSTDGATLDIDRLRREMPELAASYSKVVPGSRRFLVDV